MAQKPDGDGGGGLRRDRRGGLLQSEPPSDSAGRQTGFLMQRRAVEQARRTSERPRAEACAGFRGLRRDRWLSQTAQCVRAYTPSDFEREQRALDQLGL